MAKSNIESNRKQEFEIPVIVVPQPYDAVMHVKAKSLEDAKRKAVAWEHDEIDEGGVDVRDLATVVVDGDLLSQTELVEEVKKVLDYLWKDEERHYQECDECDGHIFLSLKKLDEHIRALEEGM